MEQAEIHNILDQHFKIAPAAIQPLQGYETATYRLQCAGRVNILKRYPLSDATLQWTSEESRVLEVLAEKAPGRFPAIMTSAEGQTEVVEAGAIYRLLSFLPGEFLSSSSQTQALIRDFGSFMGSLSSYLNPLPAGVIASKESAWDLQYLLKNRPMLAYIKNPKDRALIDYFLRHFEQEVLPHRNTLRKAVIHNDANDWNVLCKGEEVTGLIDFGDMCYSWQVNEPAVALTYVLMGAEDPLEVARIFLEAYHGVFPLTPLEADLLYPLIAGRLCMSLCQSAHALSEAREPVDPEHSDYIAISRGPALDLLHRWVQINPLRARRIFQEAIGANPPESCETGEILEARRRYFSTSLSLSYKDPILMDRAAMQYMYDGSGNTYLDAYNNIMLVGHAHPRVVRAASEAMGRLNTNTRYLYPILTRYAERLLGHFPKGLSKLFLVNSGSAATDLALRLARTHTTREKVLALAHGYHGNTAAGIAVSHYKHRQGHAYPGTLIGPFPKVAGKASIDTLTDAYADLLRENRGTIGAFIAEPIMGCGGQLPLPAGFLERLYPLVRAQGGVCISDEVQVGFGRLGQWMWGFEMHGVVPDIVILGKPMGNGHPIGGVVTTAAIAESFESGPEFFSSFGGNPVSCAVGHAVLEVLESEQLQSRAAETGNHLLEGLGHLRQRYSSIRDVRGSGLFLGVEFQDAAGQPDGSLARQVCEMLKERYILTSTDGPENNVLKIKPPLPFNTENADTLLLEMRRILQNISPS